MRKFAGRTAIISEIQNRIETGQFVTGQRLPSERHLANEFGVSRASVQGAIVELQALGVLDRTPNCRPVVLGTNGKSSHPVRPTKDQIAIWMYPTLDELGATTMLQGMRMALGAAGYNMVIGCAESDDLTKAQASEEGFLRSLSANSSIAGAIIWQTGSRDFARAYDLLVKANIPLVFVDREPPEPILCDVVSANNRRAARTAVKHLVDLGHRKIAMIVNRERVSSVEDRLDGYASVLRESGIPLRDDYIIRLDFASRQIQHFDANQLVNSILGLPDPPTALFAVNDQTAMFVMDALTRRGVAIPDELSIVGFDWLLRWLPSGGNLTTISQPVEAIGKVAAERLLERIRSRVQDPPRQILLEASLVVRDSTSVPREGKVRDLEGIGARA
jgi:LacI family transcriptional regulator